MKEQEFGDFKIEQSITIEELEQNKDDRYWLEKNIITLEELLKDNQSIQISKDDIEKFYNGVKIPVSVPDGTYSIYCDNKFIGSGISEKNRVKRDVIVG